MIVSIYMPSVTRGEAVWACDVAMDIMRWYTRSAEQYSRNGIQAQVPADHVVRASNIIHALSLCLEGNVES